MSLKTNFSLVALALLAGGVGGAIFSLMLKMGLSSVDHHSPGADIIKTREMQLVDSDGNVHARLYLDYPNELQMKVRKVLGSANPSGPIPKFELFDLNGKAMLSMSITSDGSAYLQMSGAPELELVDFNGNQRMALSLSDEGGPSVGLYGNGGFKNSTAASISMDVTQDDEAKLTMSHRSEPGVSLGIDSKGARHLYFYKHAPSARESPTLLSMETSENRFSNLVLEDFSRAKICLGNTELENIRTGVTERRPASSIVLFDKDGIVFWKAPAAF